MSNDRIVGSTSNFRRRDLRIVEHPVDAFAALGAPVDFETAPDVVVDEVAHGETDVRLEGIDAMRVQPVAQHGRVGRRPDIDARDGSAGERSPGRGALMRRAEFARTRRVRRRHVEARRPAVVAHEESLALFQPAEQVHDGDALTDPVARLDDEAAHVHRPSGTGNLATAGARRVNDGSAEPGGGDFGAFTSRPMIDGRPSREARTSGHVHGSILTPAHDGPGRG